MERSATAVGTASGQLPLSGAQATRASGDGCECVGEAVLVWVAEHAESETAIK